MKKIIKSILFMVILIILLIILSYIFIPKDNVEDAGMRKYGASKILGEQENTIDMIAFGNSESFTSFIPMKLWEDYGYSSYICGYPGQALPDVVKIMNEVTKKQKPKVIVLEANVLYDEVPIVVPPSRILQTALPILEYHDRWKSLQLKDFKNEIKYTSTDYMKGFHFKTDKNEPDLTGYMNYSDKVQELSIINKTCLDIMKNYCKNNDIKFIIMSVPSPINWNYEKHNRIEQYAKKEEIDFIDFNLLTDELKIDWKEDSLDKGDHMNFYGSLKITDYFGKYLNNKQLIKSHKEEQMYSKWNEDFNKYKKEIEKAYI